MTKRYLFYVEQNYSFEILRPLQEEILKRGDTVKWFAKGKEINIGNLTSDEKLITNIEGVVSYSPHACFVPGNVIPSFISGIKVQVFHGLEWKKKGHFVIRDCFDLYCTHGKATTGKFLELAEKHGNFEVLETGWPKLDNLFTTPKKQYFENNNPCILYAPTFSPALTSAPALFEEIKKSVKDKTRNWIVKFHPKMDKTWIARYQTLTCENFKVLSQSNLNEVLQSADLMVSDTSSAIGEFSLLHKPIISLNNSAPGDYLINISDPGDLQSALEKALAPSKELTQSIMTYADNLHPFSDGNSSSRILNAVENIMLNGKTANKKLPLNLFRNLKQRKALNYWRW